MKQLLFFFFKKLKKLFAGRGLRKVRIIDWLYRFSLERLYPHGITQVTYHGNKMYVNAEDGGVGFLLLLNTGYEKYEMELLKSLVKPGMIVADIGANVGCYSLVLAKLVGNKGRVFAFEPEPSNFALLCRNIKINGYTNITAVQKALSNRTGRLKLFLDKTNLGSHSISERNLRDAVDSVEVESITLDAFMEQVDVGRSDFIKMDVQGAEGAVVEGATNVLKGKNIAMMLEFWPYGLRNLGTDPLKLLQQFRIDGFRITVIDGQNRCKKQLDQRQIVEMCENEKEGWGYCNLLLEK